MSIPKIEHLAIDIKDTEEETECEHEEHDHGICVDCGEDITEWLVMAAYDRAKDRWDD